MKVTVHTRSAEETIDLGRRLGELLEAGAVLAFFGDLGAGKTTMTKGVGLGLGVQTEVHSPTFTLIHEYPGRLSLYHIDLYRLLSEEDVEALGIEDYLYGDGVTIIEWADRMPHLLPENTLRITLYMTGDEDRDIEFVSDLESNRSLLEGLEAYARARY